MPRPLHAAGSGLEDVVARGGALAWTAGEVVADRELADRLERPDDAERGEHLVADVARNFSETSALILSPFDGLAAVLVEDRLDGGLLRRVGSM